MDESIKNYVDECKSRLVYDGIGGLEDECMSS